MAETILFYTEEEEAFISGVEFAMDYRLPIPEADYIRYQELTKRIS